MNPPFSPVPVPAFRLVIRLRPACDFAAIRQAAIVAREWLAVQNLPEAELADWELVLVEAGNNAVEHATEAMRARPVEVEISCGETDVEARVTDHTPGFDLPEEVVLPDLESEGSRGLFLIKSLSDEVEYRRHPHGNVLLLRKRRAAAAPHQAPNTAELQRRLAESERVVAEMTEELSSCYESLVALFRYSAELGASTNLLEFTRRLLGDLAQLTETDVVVLRLLDPDQGLNNCLTWPEELAERVPGGFPAAHPASRELQALKTREDTWFDSEQPLDAADPLRALPGVKAGICHAVGWNEQWLGTVTLARRGSGRPYRSAQINLLHTLVDFLAIQIGNSRLLDERTRAQVTRRELEIAASIQRSLLPACLPTCAPFDLAASCTSARAIGGDFYDAIPVDGQGLLLVIADVMGKGVPAALFAAVLRSAIRSMPGLFTHPAGLLKAVNRTLYEDLSRVDMFVTAEVVFLDPNHNHLISASAGHCPFHVSLPGWSLAAPVGDAGLPLGIDGAADYLQSITPFPPGSVGILYTDGVTESAGPAGDFFGADRLARALPELAREAATIEDLRAALLGVLESHRAGKPPNDDQTFLLLRNKR